MQKASTEANVFANANAKNDADTALTRKETREIITPYAFHVSDDLFGTPLASPARRGFSMLIDLILVGFLTQVSSLVLAIVAAFTFFRAGNRLKQKKRFNAARIFLRLLTAVLLFVVVLGVVEVFKENLNETDAFNDVDFNGVVLSDAESLEVLGVTAKYFMQTAQLRKDVKNGECKNAYVCWKELGDRIITDIDELRISKEKGLSFLNTFIEATEDSLTPAQQSALEKHMKNTLEQRLMAKNLIADSSTNNAIGTAPAAEKTVPAAEKTVPAAEQTTPVAEQTAPVAEQTALVAKQVIPAANQNVQQKISDAIELADNIPAKEPGIIDALKEIAEELGWGLGWAAFYFSVFTAWWRGQTPGKRLLGIKVIKLDGGDLNLWESFGRYGGYSAGLATGLSGFLQVYWDPNRQAIQDKISETLVINIRKPKVAFELGTETNPIETENKVVESSE